MDDARCGRPHRCVLTFTTQAPPAPAGRVRSRGFVSVRECVGIPYGKRWVRKKRERRPMKECAIRDSQ